MATADHAAGTNVIYDRRAAAAGDDPNVALDLAAADPRHGRDDAPADRAPQSAFAGRDDAAAIDELAAELRTADADGLEHLRRIVTDRMDRGDLSSLAAMKLYQAANARLDQLRRRHP
jgi:hypothetical protein